MHALSDTASCHGGALRSHNMLSLAPRAASVAFSLDGTPVVLRAGVHYFADGVERLRADASVRRACEAAGAGALAAALLATGAH